MGWTSWYSLPRSSPSPIVTPSHQNSRVRPTKLAPTTRRRDPALLGPQSAQADFDTDFVFEVEEDEAEVENGDAARETLSDESNWEGNEVEEEELTAEEASRRAQMGDAGSRHLARKADEITNPFANVLYGYVSEFYASERYTRSDGTAATLVSVPTHPTTPTTTHPHTVRYPRPWGTRSAAWRCPW